ncbi:DNA mismatch repair endonuclease MutL [candidate division KSB1 bacterium]|nr:DNA mismatch repair endonuclease MutL [candidate division KSB1 bacterium]
MNQNVIKILPESLANKIAAGEVVERPASVVKELIENSLDAGSAEITVILKDGGQSLIQVVDDGLGMSREDVLLAFQRHTTSKITVAEDLENIHTFGFRGEALASIASVARIEMKTAQRDTANGTLLRLEGGVLTEIEDSANVPGTSIAVKNLFFNTPARRKFLRSPVSEYRQILEVMKRFILAMPQLRFLLVNDSEIIYDLKPTDLAARIQEVFGGKCKGHLINLNDQGTLIHATGYLGDWDLFRRSRGQQFLFLNKRFILSRALNHAVTSAYGAALPAEHFPLYVIFLEIDPSHVDVNVHPTKIEVKFAEEHAVYSIVRSAVSRALTTDQIIPQAQSSDSPGIFSPPEIKQSELSFDMPGGEQSFIFSPPERRGGEKFSPPPVDFMRRDWQPHGVTPAASPTRPEAAATPVAMPAPPKRPLIWQIHNRYILTQIKQGVMVVDQHVAHERILFERAMADFEQKTPSSQNLLFPEVIELSVEDYSYLKEVLPYLTQIGYDVKQFSGRAITIEAVPAGVKHAGDEKVLLEIIDEFKKSKGENFDIRENVAKSFACKTAIKAGERLTPEEMIVLIEQLFQTKIPYFCPHGRPIIITISLEELDRRFGRI